MEQAVSLMTVQDIAELADEEIIVLHRNRKPIRAKRMDWRDFPQLTAEQPSVLPILQEPEAIADWPADYPRSDEFGP